jgi:lipopolysaccharide transport system permease protein
LTTTAEPSGRYGTDTVTPGTKPIIIEPTGAWTFLKHRELWRARELIYFLAWRDIKVRYKQAALGVSWAIIQPVVTMIVFSVIFGGVARLPSEGVPYPIFTFAALLPWTYFAYLLQQGGNSLVGNGPMIGKIYFPRLSLPLGVAGAGLVDFCMSSLVLGVLVLKYQVAPGWHVVFLPAFLLLTIVAGFGLAVWLAALNVQYRDVRYVIPFLIQIGLYASPVAYSTKVVTGKVALVYALNPMATVIQGFRWSVLGIGDAPSARMLPSIVIAIVVLLTGLWYFRQMEQRFADFI